MKRSIIGLLLGLAVSALIAACQEGEATKVSRYLPTDLPQVLPTRDFPAYIKAARAHAIAVNKATETPIPNGDVAAVGPFELRPRRKGGNCQSRAQDGSIEPGDPKYRYDRGILLIHGLNDTPFSLWDLGHRFARECYLVRSILLPGHGTVPGDLLNVGLPAWRDAVTRAVFGFKGKADRLVIAGFDLGANLALDAALDVEMPPEVELNGVILLAPAFSYDPPGFAPASVGPGGRALWGDVFDHHDALRYHSVVKPSVAAVNALGRELGERAARRHVPLFMVLSADDGVTDPLAARAWFCAQSVTPRHLLWYSRYPGAPHPPCSCTAARRNPADEKAEACISVRASSCTPPAAKGRQQPGSASASCRANPYETREGDARAAILDLSHIALLAAPDNPRYGAAAEKNDCLPYSQAPDSPEARTCTGRTTGEGASHLRYGETSDDNLRNYVLRRLTYNPDFDHMARRMIEFLKRSN